MPWICWHAKHVIPNMQHGATTLSSMKNSCPICPIWKTRAANVLPYMPYTALCDKLVQRMFCTFLLDYRCLNTAFNGRWTNKQKIIINPFCCTTSPQNFRGRRKLWIGMCRYMKAWSWITCVHVNQKNSMFDKNTWSRESKWFFMHFMATYLPFFMHCAFKTSEKVPSPFFATSRYSTPAQPTQICYNPKRHCDKHTQMHDLFYKNRVPDSNRSATRAHCGVSGLSAVVH